MSPRIVVLAGEPEYDAHETMVSVADEFARAVGATVEFRVPDVIEDEPDFPLSTFGDLGVLDDADLLVVYTRFRNLADADMRALERYLAGTRPVIGLRTSTHAFHFPPDSAWAPWNERFGREVLGSPWISHHGHSSSTDVELAPDAPGALTAGLPQRFHARSWLYVVDPAPWATPVLVGEPVAPETDARPGPVAWCGEPNGRRTFYTSLGHPDDLALPPVRRLLSNAVAWALGVSGDGVRTN
jgi:uncharacterized protein